MKSIPREVSESLKSKIKGQIVLPIDSSYDKVREIWNAMIERRPALIVRCAEASDVPHAISFARENGLAISIRGSGHNIAGNALCDNGLMIDFSTMRKVCVDAEKKRAYVEPGATLADFDEAAQSHGLATLVGINSTTGIAALTLGGGFGWLRREYGMTIHFARFIACISQEVAYYHGVFARALLSAKQGLSGVGEQWSRRPYDKTKKHKNTYQNMSLRINDEAPNFSAETTEGAISFHEWIGDGWAVLFSHPKDFTPVCTTELGYMAGLQPEFAKRNCKIIGLSVDPVSSHGKWAADIEETQGHRVNYPLIGDPELKVAKLYDMLPADAGTTSDGRTAANNATVRTVFVIGPDKKIKLMLVYPMTTGRNFDEVLRVLDSMQLTATHKVATPVNWKHGEDVIISSAVSDEEAKQKYPDGWKAPKPYLRIIPQPK